MLGCWGNNPIIWIIMSIILFGHCSNLSIWYLKLVNIPATDVIWLSTQFRSNCTVWSYIHYCSVCTQFRSNRFGTLNLLTLTFRWPSISEKVHRLEVTDFDVNVRDSRTGCNDFFKLSSFGFVWLGFTTQLHKQSLRTNPFSLVSTFGSEPWLLGQ